jgi:cbb3-type cytochrome oxidase maturation protein
MTVMLVLIGVSLLAGAIGLTSFLWSLSNGQYDDMEGNAIRILFDDAGVPPPHAEQGAAPADPPKVT